MGRWHRNKESNWCTAIVAGALSAAAMMVTPNVAQAGLLDFLFGGFQQRSTPPGVNSYAEPSAPVAPPPLGSESMHQGVNGGRSVGFCVRLCDGQNFPLEHVANATPVETCRSMCPASKTKVFFGSEIDHSVAADGARYADTDNAYVYRKNLVTNCTCNGKDAFGLAPLDVKNDPTLRPGDIVATKDGFVAFSGKRGQAATFTPVDASSVAADLNPAGVRANRRIESARVDDGQAPQSELRR